MASPSQGVSADLADVPIGQSIEPVNADEQASVPVTESTYVPESSLPDKVIAIPVNPISALYEYASKRKLRSPIFECSTMQMKVTRVNTFESTVSLPSQPGLTGRGVAKSKQEAKAAASQDLLQKLQCQDESLLQAAPAQDAVDSISSVSGTPSSAASGHQPSTPKKRPFPAGSTFPDIDEKNPIPTMIGILRRVDWPDMVHLELGSTCGGGSQGLFEHSCQAVPGDADQQTDKKYLALGLGKTAKAARAAATVELYKLLRDCPDFQRLYKSVRVSKSGKKQKLTVWKDPASAIAEPVTDGKPYSALNEATVHLDHALKKQPRTESPYQSMESKLGMVLEHMRSFARQAAEFLGTSIDLKAGPDSQRHFISVSAVLEEVARKLPESNMAVEFWLKDSGTDWSQDVYMKDENFATETSTKSENQQNLNNSEAEDGQIIETSLETDDAVKPENLPEKKLESSDTDASNDLPVDALSVKTEYAIYNDVSTTVMVDLEVRWQEDMSHFPRQLNFPGTGDSFDSARDHAAQEFFLFFGLRDDEFEIMKVG